jgi:uncharacterized membrane protein
MIALFGGLAGIIATTRKEKSNTIPGVAIATALMPPLCTAGFGLANGNLEFFFGAFYLFTINCVFIALSAVIVIKAFHTPQVEFINKQAYQRVHVYLGIAVALTVLPSLYLAYQLVGEEIFKSKAMQFVRDEIESQKSHIVSTVIDPKSRLIQVTLVGEIIPQKILSSVAAKMSSAGLTSSELKVFQNGEQTIDVAAMKSTLLHDLYNVNQVELDRKSKLIEKLTQEIHSLQDRQNRLHDLPDELLAIYPQISIVNISESPDWHKTTGWSKTNTLVLTLQTTRPLHKADKQRIEQWASARLKTSAIRLSVERAPS